MFSKLKQRPIFDHTKIIYTSNTPFDSNFSDPMEKIEAQWSNMVSWLYRQSEPNSKRLALFYKKFISKISNQASSRDEFIKVSYYESKLKMTKKLTEIAKNHSFILEKKYLLGSVLNRLFHEIKNNNVEKFTLLKLVKEFAKFLREHDQFEIIKTMTNLHLSWKNSRNKDNKTLLPQSFNSGLSHFHQISEIKSFVKVSL